MVENKGAAAIADAGAEPPDMVRLVATDQAIELAYRVDADLIYETMKATGRALMARRERKTRSGWRALGVWLVIMVGLAALIDLLSAAELSVEILYVFLGVIVGFAIYTAFLNRAYRRVARLMAASPVYAGRLTTVMDASGVRISGDAASIRLGWQAVEGVLALKSGLALIVPSELVPIPDAALPEGLSREALQHRIQAWRDAAGDGGAG